jgi:TonB-dependent SusC/RagA subfamily outer membrane receptor
MTRCFRAHLRRLHRLTARCVTLALVCSPTLLHAQTGQVVGVVIDQSSAQPVEGALVLIQGGNIAGATDRRGHFIIRGVPAGSVSVRAQRLGFKPATQLVRVPANDSVSVRFALTLSVVELESVVTTGTGGAVEKKQLGAPLGIVNVDALADTKPIPDLSSALQSQIPGLRAIDGGGGAGAAKDLRIRGMSSFTLSQRPAVYVDGVKIDTKAVDWSSTMPNQGCCNFNGGVGEDRLSDLNPNDIDRIEVLKGPAAATLYGSDASNGVIQIFTKKGRLDSSPTWSFAVTGGYDRAPENYPTHLYPNFTGADGTRALDMNKTLIGNGPYQEYQINVNGGANRATYFVSGGFTKEVGSIQPNDARRGTLRVNVAWQPTEKMNFEARSSYGRNYINSLQGGNNWTALTGNASNGDPRNATKLRPYGEAWVAVSDIQKMTSFSDANRYTGGATISYQATPSLLSRFTVGVDLTNDNKQRFFPYDGNFGSASVFNGEKDDAFRYYSNYTADYLAQYSMKLPHGITSDFAVGGQGYYETEQLNLAVGKQYPGPGVSTVTAASQTFGSETYAHTVNIGGYAQDRLSISDRFFTTVGFRIDGNSAFGKNYGYQKYPKVDAAYNVGGLSWVPGVVSSLKFRGAWGRAGKTPGPFDQYQTYRPEAVFSNTPALTPYNPGNTILAPEITTAIDAGFDAGFFSDRLGLEATYYRQKTNDAITSVTLPPSQGFSQAQKQNIGGIVNNGWEAALNWLTVSRRDLEWHNDFRFDGNKNKVTNLNGHIIGSNTTIRLGYPVQGVWMLRPVSYNATTKTWVRSDTTLFQGPPLPTFNFSYAPSLRWRSFQIVALVTLERGAIISNSDRPYRFRQHTGDEFLSLLGANGANTPASDSAIKYWAAFDDPEKRDNTRIRQIALTYEVPAFVSSRLGLGRTTFTASEQNVKIWANCHCQDPDFATYVGSDFSGTLGFLADPAPHQFRFAVRSRF